MFIRISANCLVGDFSVHGLTEIDNLLKLHMLLRWPARDSRSMQSLLHRIKVCGRSTASISLWEAR